MSSARYETIVVTGAAGFVGRHLLAHLARAADRPRRVVALDLRPGQGGEAEWAVCNLADAAQVAGALRQIKPQGIIHLAAVAQGSDLQAYFAANVQACARVLAAAADLAQPPRVLVVGSAAQYGVASGTDEVVDETRPLRGETPYALSKTLQERWALLYAGQRRLPVVAVRPFNIIGPGQPPGLVPAAFLHQVADVLAGRAPEVRVGNTSSERDFTDVRDMVTALWALMNAGDSVVGQVFNIASGEAVRIADLLGACLALAGRDVPVRQEASRLKAVDVPRIIGDASKLRAATGWRPTIGWRQSLADMWQAICSGRAAGGG